MFNYYRFIGSKLSDVLTLLESQAELAGYELVIIDETAGYNPRANCIFVVYQDNLITDIYQG